MVSPGEIPAAARPLDDKMNGAAKPTAAAAPEVFRKSRREDTDESFMIMLWFKWQRAVSQAARQKIGLDWHGLNSMRRELAEGPPLC
jgi:hypothetical protein